MKRKQSVTELVLQAMSKLETANGERNNVQAFVHVCYGGRKLTCDYAKAQISMAKLTDEEQHALINFILLN
jgi:hypothetical protein